jgi:hypothetical protein
MIPTASSQLASPTDICGKGAEKEKINKRNGNISK